MLLLCPFGVSQTEKFLDSRTMTFSIRDNFKQARSNSGEPGKPYFLSIICSFHQLIVPGFRVNQSVCNFEEFGIDSKKYKLVSENCL